MVFKSIIGALSIFLSALYFNVNAVLVSMDWQLSGDDLITHDTVTGLNWLDLTETNGVSYNYVSTQLGSGGKFEGFRYATVEEVIDLWANFDIGLSSDVAGSVYGIDTNVITASDMLGNILCEYNCVTWPYGVLGFTEIDLVFGFSHVMGSYIVTPHVGDATTSYWREGFNFSSSSVAESILEVT